MAAGPAALEEAADWAVGTSAAVGLAAVSRRGARQLPRLQSQPAHGAIFWTGSNSALDAEPFALNGQSQVQPASGTNRFGITFISAPYIPHLIKPSGKDTFFPTLSGTRSSNPLDEYATGAH